MERSQEGSTEEAIRCRANKCLNEYDYKLYEINRPLVDLKKEGRDPDEFSTRPLSPIISWRNQSRLVQDAIIRAV